MSKTQSHESRSQFILQFCYANETEGNSEPLKMALANRISSRNFLNSRSLLRGLSIRKTSAKAQAAYELPTTAPDDLADEHIFNEEHIQMRNSLYKIIQKDINPYVEEWEREKQFPAHKIFKKLGDAGLLGVTKPVEFGGLGLDYSYSVALAEELGKIQKQNIVYVQLY